MERTVRAIGFRRYGSADQLEWIEIEQPQLGADQVLVRVGAAGVNPADWRIRSGQFRLAMFGKLPFVPGADVAGVVEAVGAQVTRVRPGDAVYAMLPTMNGGGYASHALVAERNVALMPLNLSFVEAAAVPLTALTALQALRDKAELQPGAALLVNGASGGVGSFAVQLGTLYGAQVTAVCSGRNIELVRSLGAHDAIDYTREDVLAGRPRYDVIFDTVDRYPFRRWRRVLRPGGAVVSVNPLSALTGPRWIERFRQGQRQRSIFVQPSGADLQVLSGWIAAGQLRPLIDRCYPLAEAAAAQRYSETQRVRGKLVLVVDEQLAASRGSGTQLASLTPAAPRAAALV